MGALQGEANARLAGLYRYRIPLTRPLQLAGREYGERSGLLLRLSERGADGAWREGVGEAAPLPGFSPETLAQCQQALIAAAERWQQGASPLSASDPLPPSAAFGWDCALAELQQGPLLWPASATSDPYPLLDGEPAALLHRWQQWPAPRPALIKLKLGRRDSATEAALIRTLLQHTPTLRLRLDANRAWSLAEASAFCAVLTPSERQQIDYLEEPCHHLAESL
ncbi:MAG TPA: o-succinylbenzoate synthase, partial [Motiliproteus sp.]